VIERTNDEWLANLRAPGPVREAALNDLRRIIVAGLPYALASWLSPSAPQFDALAEDVAQETLLQVLAHLDAFEGRSRFITWANKIAIRIALTELRRRRWKDVSLEALLGEGGELAVPTSVGDPARAAEQAEVVALLDRMITEELTPKQRQAMLAKHIKGMPLEEVARRMGMKRNTLYKLLHDARLRLKRRMVSEGLEPGEVLAVFEPA